MSDAVITRRLAMKTLLHVLKVAPRWDREVLAIVVGGCALLLTLGAAAELLAS